MEDLLDGLLEVARERDRQGQRRRVALLLDGVDGLARDVHRFRKRLLRELAAGAERADVVLHGWKANFTSEPPPMSSSLSIEGGFAAAQLGHRLVAVHPLARDPVPVVARPQLPEHREREQLDPAAEDV